MLYQRLVTACCLITITAGIAVAQEPGTAPKTENAAKKGNGKVERARQTVRMLDDIYKGGVVAITDTYVNDESTIPAGTAFKSLFKAAEAKGWHRVRLLDVTGDPYDDSNVAEDAFEKSAVKKIAGGKPWVEAIEVRKGTRHLRVLTAIPVVMEKCVMCHDNYADLAKGQAIGALSYTIPVDGPLVTDAAEKVKK
ncbi:MAG: hypothetical protein Aurels2KO_31950 [Aureliella sp.]